MNVEKTLLRIVEMYCVRCKSVVENQLKGEKGIKKISLDYMTEGNSRI